MATYKVIQDIEAEDKLVGPLTLRQFIYAGVSAVCLYICFLAYTKNAQFLLAFFLPPAVVSGFFAFPWRGEQPTEIWALARLRFMIKPRVRIWDQDGAKDLVSITVPRKLETRRPVRNLSQVEVRSRLKALADTIDSRGWATRNAAYGVYNQTWAAQNAAPVPGNTGIAVSMPSDDMFDDQNSVAQNFDALLTKSSQQKRERVIQSMAQAQNPQPSPSGATPLESFLPPDPVPQPMFQAPSLPAPVMTGYIGYGAPVPQQAMPTQQAYGYTGQQVQPQQYVQNQMQPQQYAQPANNLWFANGPAFPANPQTIPQQMVAAPLPGTVAPSMPQQPVQQYAQPAAIMPSLPAPLTEEQLPASVTMPTDTMAVAPALAAVPTDNPTADTGIAPPSETPAASITGVPEGQPMTTDLPSYIESDVPLPTAATPSAEDAAAGDDIRQRSDAAMAINLGHMRVLQPVGSEPIPGVSQAPAAAVAPQSAATPQPVTAPTDPAILELANNDDLDIATLARQASRDINRTPDEVEINLH